jgi:hypothetical protein
MKKEKSAYIIKLGADGFLATITPLPVALVLGFFFVHNQLERIENRQGTYISE